MIQPFPYEFIKEKVAAGIPVTLQYCGFVDNEQTMVEYAGYVKAVCDEYGVQFESSHAGGDVSNMIAQVENFITMGTNIIFLLPPDGSTVKDAVVKAQEAGIVVVAYGVSDGDYAVTTYSDQWTKGYMCGEMMYEYAMRENPNAAPGSIKVALLGSVAIPPQMQQYQGFYDSVMSHEELNLCYTFDGVDSKIDSGFDATQNALTYDSEIRYILVQNNAPDVGACNYIAALPDADLSEYHVFCTGRDTAITELGELTEAGQSCLRGTIDSDRSNAEYIGQITRMILNNEVFKEYALVFKLDAITYGWDFTYSNEDVDQSLNPF